MLYKSFFVRKKKIVENFNISEINIIIVVLECIWQTCANMFKNFSFYTGFLNSGHFNINNIVKKRNLLLTSVLCVDHIFIKYQIWTEREIIFTDFWHFVSVIFQKINNLKNYLIIAKSIQGVW